MRVNQEGLLERMRREKPLIHCITNYVTAGEVANYLLAAGASPVMAEGPREVEEIAASARALVLNLGTLQEEKLPAMELAGKKAASLGRPVVLDPVGAGGASFRTESAKRLMQMIPCTVIRGNASEILALAEERHTAYGVDAGEKDMLTDENLRRHIQAAQNLSRTSGAVIIMTGKADLVADAKRYCLVRNGHPMMARITGTGCMLDALTAAFLSVAPETEGEQTDIFGKAVYAAAAHGICGELAWERTKEQEGGAGSFRLHFIDAVSMLTDRQIQEGARIEI